MNERNNKKVVGKMSQLFSMTSATMPRRFNMMKLTKTKLLASLILAILFSMTCAAEDGGNTGGGNNPTPTPLTVKDQTFTVSENADLEETLGIVAVASNPESKPLTYSITSNDNNLFKINATSGLLSLADEKSLDYEIKTSHTIMIEVSDGEMSSTATIILMVENVTIGDRYCGTGTETNPPVIDDDSSTPLDSFFAGGTGSATDPFVIPVKADCQGFTFDFDPNYTTTFPALHFAIDFVAGDYQLFIRQVEDLNRGDNADKEGESWEISGSHGGKSLFSAQGFLDLQRAPRERSVNSYSFVDEANGRGRLLITFTSDIAGVRSGTAAAEAEGSAAEGRGWYSKKGLRFEKAMPMP